jgi:hypothetical protein
VNAMLVCFPLRCEWDALNPLTAPAWPSPVHTSLMPAPQDVPDPVSDLAVWARTFGWKTLVTYSEGWVPGQRSEKAKKIWAVRCSRGTRRAVAVREDGSWHSLWSFGQGLAFTKTVLLDQFKQDLAG